MRRALLLWLGLVLLAASEGCTGLASSSATDQAVPTDLAGATDIASAADQGNRVCAFDVVGDRFDDRCTFGP